MTPPSAETKEAKNVMKVLDFMHKVFPGKTPELSKNNVVSLFVLFSDLLANYDIAGKEKEIAKWFSDFEDLRKKEKRKDPEKQDSKMAIYENKIVNATATMDSLKYRHSYLKENFLEHIEVPKRDSNRLFDEEQRRVIYRRDGGICQKCGKECKWDAWEADHIVPWTHGGKTVVSNGQVLCPTCNSKKGAN